MPKRTNITEVPVYSGAFGPNGAVLEGRVWTTQPLLPTPDDTSPQRAAYVALNGNKMLEVDCWLGVKYGETPTGNLRFKPCQQYDYPAGTFPAVDEPKVPYQRYEQELDSDGRYDLGKPDMGAYNWIERGTIESEDCLTFNAWRPKNATGRPMIVMIHGGGWTVNSANAPHAQGHRLAAHKGVVAFTIEYRAGAFGHFPHPDLIEAGEPSVAYTDIKTALKTIWENAAAFGGDPTKLLVIGTSAGGAAVQLLMEDDEAQGWFTSAMPCSGGGLAEYLDSSYYNPRYLQFEKAIRIASGFLTSASPTYKTVADALEAESFAWVMQNAMRVDNVLALSERRKAVVDKSFSGTTYVPSDNVYPFKRSTYKSAVDAAKAGKYRKPFISLFSECEALNLLGSSRIQIRDTLLALSTATLDNWSRRLGYSSYSDWLNASWQPAGGLGALSSSLLPSSDPANGDAESRRVLYTHAVFGFPAWRVARAAFETGSATSYLMCNNFSANGEYAGHSTEIPMIFGTNGWLVGKAGYKDDPNYPGEYANNWMDSFYVSEIMQQKVAALAATGDPNGAYSYTGFDLFSDPATLPDSPGSITATLQAYTTTQPGHMNVLGKWFDPLDNLNAITPTLGGHRDARVQYVAMMNGAMLDYYSRTG